MAYRLANPLVADLSVALRRNIYLYNTLVRDTKTNVVKRNSVNSP
jgi:hypothetical protein